MLRSSARDIPDRQRTLEATIDWSYGLLSPVEQELFRNLAVLTGGCSLDAAETVCSADPDVLEALVQKNLVLQRRDVEGHARFLMLATVREFATDQLEAGDHGAVRRSHAAWVCRLAEEAEPNLLGQEQVRWMGRLDEEFANVRAAVGTSLAAGDAETALRISSALVDFWDARGTTTRPAAGSSRGWGPTTGRTTGCARSRFWRLRWRRSIAPMSKRGSHSPSRASRSAGRPAATACTREGLPRWRH